MVSFITYITYILYVTYLNFVFKLTEEVGVFTGGSVTASNAETPVCYCTQQPGPQLQISLHFLLCCCSIYHGYSR